MQKPLIFISHITEEKDIAIALKGLAEAAFLNMIEVFVSSDPTSIKAGRKWLNEITESLKNCAIEIILASPESVKRPWINFEAGAGWIRDIPVIPLCHSGMLPPKLPPPLSSLQAATATSESELAMIFSVLADAVGCTLPRIDPSSFITTVKEFEIDSQQFKKMTAETPVAKTGGLSPHELATLIEIAEQTYAPDEVVAIHQVRNALEKAGYRGVAVTLALKMLARKDLVEITKESCGYNNEEYPVVRLSHEGWTWLEGNQGVLCLTNDSPPLETAITPATHVENTESDDIPF